MEETGLFRRYNVKLYIGDKGQRIISRIVILITAILFFVTFMYCNVAAAKEAGYDYKTVKACWISYLDFETYLCDSDEESFRQTVDYMYDRLLTYDINTVIVQVRPMGDAIYPSICYPVSKYISSARDISAYDPLKIMVEAAHKKGLRFEAWINPYRLSKNSETTEEYKKLACYEARGDYIYSYTNQSGEECLSLDPVRQESIQLIVDGVCEVVRNYAVDAIHFDDYFFVDGMYEDMPAEERMTYVNSMISQVYEAIKELDAGCEFGVSPSGNIEVARNQGVDVDKWLSTPGYIDYIMPQIYWTDNYETDEGVVTMFSDMSGAWQELNCMDMPIYVGLALYRAGEINDRDHGWSESDDNLGRSWLIALENDYEGYALFRYEWFDKELSYNELDNLKKCEDEYLRGKNCDIFNIILNIGINHTMFGTK